MIVVLHGAPSFLKWGWGEGHDWAGKVQWETSGGSPIDSGQYEPSGRLSCLSIVILPVCLRGHLCLSLLPCQVGCCLALRLAA